MNNNERIEYLLELKRRVDEADCVDFSDALTAVLPHLTALDKIFYGRDDLRDLALDYLVGKASLEDVRKAMDDS